MQTERNSGTATVASRTPEPRYAYYRRCQRFRRNGEQCKAPAMKQEVICHQHAAEEETAQRRRQSRQALIARIAQLQRARFGSAANLFTSFESIQHAIGEVMRALIDGRINCKTAGRLAIDLQTAAKLLRLITKSKSTTETRR